MRGPARRASRNLAVAVWVVSVVVSGCAVERPDDLLGRLWLCDASADCLDGWACADRSVFGDDFCRPACDRADPSSCDGVCTATGECLAACTLRGSDTTSCPSGHSCIRTDLLGNEGVCFPTTSCSRSDECGEGTRCFNDVFQLPAILSGVEYSSDHLYCVAVPDAMERCATGYALVPALGEQAPLCLPRCDTEGSRCPPDLTCLRDLGYLFAQPGVDLCYAGYWGLPCDDDAQCMVGRCLQVGEGKRACTYSCAEADSTFGRPGAGCDALEATTRGLRLDALDVRCESVGGQDVCVPLGTPGASCNEDMRCAPGLECRAFTSGSTALSFCSRDCVDDQECSYEGAPATAFCQRDEGGSSCLPRSFEGGSCARAEQCRPGLVCTDMVCVPGPGV